MHYKNGFLTFMFSFVPGGGHMYLGLMKRGLHFMAAFFLMFAVTATLDIAPIGAPLIMLIWFYSFFDTIHARRALLLGEQVPDQGLVNIELKPISSYHIGIALIILGILTALRSLENILFQSLGSQIRYVVHQMQGFVLPALLILGGLYLIQNHRK